MIGLVGGLRPAGGAFFVQQKKLSRPEKTRELLMSQMSVVLVVVVAGSKLRILNQRR